MAAKWDEWRKSKVNTVPPKDGEPVNGQQEEQQNDDQQKSKKLLILICPSRQKKRTRE
ncbi:hypothetical protein [Paenibacillus polymyxa]|uniref:hypothetical protein n=1 Tax=Paenibacillus polymyxa TaxID=1406 RepID=UPI000B02E6E7|nr:hypothetical protein [Paenibacillus polymyxa]